jgi:hypothetical protein
MSISIGYSYSLGSQGGVGGNPLAVITTLAAEAATASLVPSLPQGTGTGATHPSVFDAGIGNTWNGYRYWMAYTPYPGDADEQPFIVTSDDGWVWAEPAGISNPIEPAPPGSPSDFNNDTDMIMSADGTTLLLTFGFFDGSEQTHTVFLKTSTDGINWTEKTELFTRYHMASQSFSYKEGVYYLTYNVFGDSGQSPTSLFRRSSTDLITWTAEEAVAFTPPAGKEVWHLEARYFSEFDKFILLAGCKTIAASSIGTDTFVAGISDDGLDYGSAIPLFVAGNSADGWDTSRTYRGSLIRSQTGFDVWYGGGIAAAWRVGRTKITINPGQDDDLLLDTVATTATHAYSLTRYLKKSYVNRPVALIRRSSDDDHTYVYPDPSGQLIADSGDPLTTWLGGATAYCATLFDQTGNRRTMTQPDAAAQFVVNPSVAAIGNRAALVGDGTRFLRTWAATHRTICNCIAGVSQLTASVTGQLWGNSASQAFGHSSANLRFFNGVTILVANQTANWASYVAVNQDGTNASFMRKDGVTLATGTRSGPSSNQNQCLGAYLSSNTPQQMLYGQCSELILSNDAFTQADYEGIEASQLDFYEL